MHLKLADGGKCVFVIGGYIEGSVSGQKISEGFGGPCTYTLNGDVVSITALGGFDEKGPMEQVPADKPIQFRIEPSGDISVVTGKARLLKRESK